MKTSREYLLDMVEYIDKIETFTDEGRDHFYADEKTQMAVIRCYEVIGEIVKRLPEAMLQQQNHIPWKKIKGFRDFLSHHYEEVTLDIIWQAVEEMPDLRTTVETMLASLSSSDQDSQN